MGLAEEGVTYVGSPGDPTGLAGWQGEKMALTLAVPHCLTYCLTLPGSGPWLGFCVLGHSSKAGRSQYILG